MQSNVQKNFDNAALLWKCNICKPILIYDMFVMGHNYKKCVHDGCLCVYCLNPHNPSYSGSHNCENRFIGENYSSIYILSDDDIRKKLDLINA
jgi:hypothetical protein